MDPRRLRILCLTACYDGGVLTYLYKLASGLSSLGHEIIVAGPSNTRLQESMRELEEVRYVGLPISTGFAYSDIAVARWLRNNATNTKVDIVHSHSIKAGLLAALARPKAARNCCYVYTPHMLHKSKTTRRSYSVYMLERWATRRHDLLIFGSETERIKYLDCGMSSNGKTATVYCPMDAKPGSKRHTRYRDKLGLVGKWPILGTICRLESQKGIDYLLRSIKLLSQQFPSMKVLIGGYGSLEASLQALARKEGVQDYVMFLGPIDDPSALLRDLDLFVLPSRWEGLPITLLEAGIDGVPVVATDVGAVREMVDDSTGWLVSPNSVESLAAGVAECLASQKEAAYRASRLQEKVATSCSGTRMVDAVLEAYYEGIRALMTSGDMA